MKAYLCRRYGGPEVLRLEEVATPVAGPGQVLVRVQATTVNSGDVRVRGCDFPPGMKLLGRLVLGWNGPRSPILGTELAGVVEAVGEGVSRFAPGDRVYAFPGGKMGAHAQFVVIPETGPIAPVPQGLDVNTAAALCFGGTTALHYLRKAELQPGQSLLVLGGSGAVGLALVQLGRHRGATVTATTSARNLALLSEYGAHHVIDYGATDVARLGQQFDIVADAVGVMDFGSAQHLLKPGGRYLAIAGALREMLGSLRPGPGGRRMIAGPAAERVDDIIELGRLAAQGVYRPHIDQVFGWEDMARAHAYVETRRKRGSVVVEVSP